MSSKSLHRKGSCQSHEWYSQEKNIKRWPCLISALFLIVNLNILLTRLNEEIGTCGVALEWLKSYLTNRVSINGSLSERFSLNCGVPQMPYLGPLLFIFYASTLFKVVEDLELPHKHCYADNTQIYLSLKPNSSISQGAIRVMECCIEKIRQWLIKDRLLVNDDKTEFMVIGTR